jgi:metal-responsive CopG/Arc/MetJ family transcriptional regulator
MKENLTSIKYLKSISLGYILSDMKNLSLKLDEKVFDETERMTGALNMSRNGYINAALRYYNSYQSNLLLRKKLGDESMLVRANSMEILSEMELLEDGNED